MHLKLTPLTLFIIQTRFFLSRFMLPFLQLGEDKSYNWNCLNLLHLGNSGIQSRNDNSFKKLISPYKKKLRNLLGSDQALQPKHFERKLLTPSTNRFGES